nr:FAD-binding protein [Psychrobacter sp. PraFG1]UNK05365.1 FAD-binding protein [Psychrobacter sp. PraFG1]
MTTTVPSDAIPSAPSSRPTKDHSKAIAELKAQFGDRLSTNLTTRQQHAHTMTWLESQPADAVLVARDKQEVAQAVAICNTHNMPVIAFGIGSSLEGQLNALMAVCVSI